MNENKLKTAVLGLNGGGKLLLDAAQKSGYFHIQAVADKNREHAEKLAAEYDCSAYDDYRQFIIQNQFDCLLVAEGTHICDEYLRMAMKKKCNILKLAPPARNFEEAAQFTQTAKDENVKFAVATPVRFAKSSLALRQFLSDPECKKEKLTSPHQPVIEESSDKKERWEPFLVTAFCRANSELTQSWRNDPTLAGGGVLLHSCYEIIDQIIFNFNIPQEVYAVKSNTAGDKQQRLYLAEDTALVTMKYSDTLFVNLLAITSPGFPKKELRLYGKEQTVTVTDSELIFSDCSGKKTESLMYDDNEFTLTARFLENFALSIIEPENNKPCASEIEHLRNMAVIEAAYLSSKTGVPEEPGRILQMQQVRPLF